MNAEQVRLIGADGTQLGIVSKDRAFILANEAGLDLVVVSETSNPPVCRILDYWKLCYDQKAKQKKQKKAHTVQKLKEIRFHLTTDDHDLGVKLKHGEEFLKKGNKVKLNLVFRGREIALKDDGLAYMNKAIEKLTPFGTMEDPPVLAGKSITASIIPN